MMPNELSVKLQTVRDMRNVQIARHVSDMRSTAHIYELAGDRVLCETDCRSGGSDVPYC